VKKVADIRQQLRLLFAFDKHCMSFPTMDPPAYPGSSHPTVASPVKGARRCHYLKKECANQ
jgi:hypothetical protein